MNVGAAAQFDQAALTLQKARDLGLQQRIARQMCRFCLRMELE